MIIRIDKTKVILSAAFVITALMLSMNVEHASAAESGEYDTKVYPGSICFFSQSAAPFTGIPNGARDDGTLENPEITGNTAEQRVTCPIVRDNSKTTGGLSLVKVYYEDNHPLQGVTCSVYRWHMKNNNLPNVSRSQSSRRDGRGELRFYSPVTSEKYWSHYTVNCSLPGKYEGKVSRIISLVVTEKG